MHLSEKFGDPLSTDPSCQPPRARCRAVLIDCFQPFQVNPVSGAAKLIGAPSIKEKGINATGIVVQLEELFGEVETVSCHFFEEWNAEYIIDSSLRG